MQPINDLHQYTDCAITLYFDNLSSNHLVENLVFHAKIKHVEKGLTRRDWDVINQDGWSNWQLVHERFELKKIKFFYLN